MAWTGITSFETTDGSTTPTDGNDIQSTGDGTGWSGNWTATTSGGDMDYDSGQSQEGSWSFLADTYTAGNNNQPRMYRALTTASSAGYLVCYVRCNVDDRNNFSIATRDSGTVRFRADFNQTTTGTARDVVTGGSTYSAKVAKDTWYKIGFDYDCTTDTYDFYIDDVKQNGSALSFASATTTVNQFYFETNAASGFSATLGYMVWVDNISDGDAAPANEVKSINGLSNV